MINSIGWPKIFKGNSSIVTSENDATLTLLHLLLSTESCDSNRTGEFFGDPDFGVNIRKYFYDQNNYVVRDVLVDEIYTKIVTFCPQVYLERSNVEITSDKTKVYVTITCKNKETFETNMYNLELFNTEEDQ